MNGNFWFVVDQPVDVQRGEDGAVLGQLRPGTPYEAVERANGWVAVRGSEGSTGWVAESAIRPIDHAGAAAGAATAQPPVGPDQPTIGTQQPTMASPIPGAAGGAGYPPAGAGPVAAGGGGRPQWPMWVGGLAVFAVIAAIVGFVVLGDEETAEAATQVVLEPVTSVGIDPFTASVVPDEPVLGGGSPEAEVVEAINPPVGELPDIDFPKLDIPTTAAGTPPVAGSAPGLYGGSQVLDVCNKSQLVDFLADNPAKANAWASVQGITPAEIPAFVDGLTDVILQVDTRVTNHGFAGGVATPIDSVLQAGTAVLVDGFGVPRVRCMCGNPLLPPRQLAPNVEVAGQSWPDFDLDKTIVITAVDPVDEFAVDDVITDEIVFRQPGTPASAATLSPTVVESGQDPSPTAGGTIATPTAGPATDPTPTVEAVPEITPGGVIDTRDYCAAFVEWSDNYDALEDGGASDAELYDYANAAYRDLATISPTPEVRNAWIHFASLSFQDLFGSESAVYDESQLEVILVDFETRCPGMGF